MKSSYIVYVGIAVGVVAMAGVLVYATENQKNYIPDNAIPATATEQGSFSSPSGLGAELNKEKWHEDPFGDLAKKVREKAGK